ncbi:hypothetical protein KAI87_14195, partial [Myxococcota bacterium]|nr:hypothetical protein [Myxococcota bacterium]
LGICIREALKDMRKSEDGGHIVNIAASTPFKGKKSGEVPALSRFVVRELDNDLRRMVKNSEAPIRISAISPTQMLATKKSKDVPETRPEDVATAILQLISDGKEVASGPRKIESVSS